MTSRRKFLKGSAVSALGLTLPLGTTGQEDEAAAPSRTVPPSTFFDVHRPPDSVLVQTEGGYVRLASGPDDRWRSGEVVVTLSEVRGALRVGLSAPSTPVSRVHLRWRGDLGEDRLLLGDAWERAYGDLEWRTFVPDRVMPWYFVTWDGERADAYGVRTGSAALCYWQADPAGITLCADVRSGGVGVVLGHRALDVCDVVCRAGRPGESAFSALHAFCRTMCPDPRLPSAPVYGHNDWYTAYGDNSAQSVLADARRIVGLSPTGRNRPFAVIDDGWQPERGKEPGGRGQWDRGNEKFPDMAGLAGRIREAGARPGIWIRPLLAPDDTPDGWRLARDQTKLDPSVPEARAKVAADIGRLKRWGYDLVKHDYTTFDVLGRWGFQMGSSPTTDGWSFAAGRSHTTAEIIRDLYGTIRTAAGDALVIGCNTVSHLSAGVFEICRIGDDTSGKEWARTRKMGVNSLGFRAPQHGAFYAADPDCVGVTRDVPWSYDRQWLDLVARSGTVLFVSVAADALNADVERDLRAGLALAARSQPLGEPSDWLRTIWPTRWRLTNRRHDYAWVGPDGITAEP